MTDPRTLPDLLSEARQMERDGRAMRAVDVLERAMAIAETNRQAVQGLIATTGAAGDKIIAERDALRARVAELEELKNAADDLARYASYAEICGGIHINRDVIRSACDSVFAVLRKIEDRKWGERDSARALLEKADD